MNDIEDFDSYVESQLDRADFMRKSIAEDEIIERQAEMWNGLSAIEKLDYIDRTRSEFKKYNWQKPHNPNLTGTENAYHPNKDKLLNILEEFDKTPDKGLKVAP